MKDIAITHHSPELGWTVFMRNFEEGDFASLCSYLGSMGLERNEGEEYRLPQITISEHTHYVEQIKRYFSDDHSLFDFIFLPEQKLLAGVWKSSKIDGEAFVDLLKHNL